MGGAVNKWPVIFALYLLCGTSLAATGKNVCEDLTVYGDPLWQCQSAAGDWQAGAPGGVTPVTVALKVPPSETVPWKVLVLSPKQSAAYDESSWQILSDFQAKEHPAMFVLFNYAGNTSAAEFALSNAVKQGFDLVISMGSQTTDYISKHYPGPLPVVTACSKDPIGLKQVSAITRKSGTHIAYTSLNIEVDTQVDYIKEKFIGDLERIAVLYDIGNVSSVQTQVQPLQDYLRDGPVEVIPIAVNVTDNADQHDRQYLHNNLYQPMQKVVASSKTVGDTMFLVTGSTELFDNISGINEAAGNIPVLSVTPSHVAAGEASVFMAIGVSFKNNAKLAADYAWRVLTGADQPGELPVGIVATPDISINFMHAPVGIRVPFYFFENADFIYNHKGEAVRCNGRNITAAASCFHPEVFHSGY